MINHNSYLERFLRFKCSPDLLLLKLFPNIKEITESFGLYDAVVNHHKHFNRNDNVNVVVVGDGSTPRTAATFAFMSRWKCLSIDPNFRKEDWPIDRLKCYKSRIQDLQEFNFGSTPTVLVLPHTHVIIQECLKKIKAVNLSVVAMECCMPLRIKEVPPDIEYVDKQILSPKNTIRIWKGIHNEVCIS